MIDIKNIPNKFYTKLAKVWFGDEWGDNEIITDDHQLKKYFEEITLGFLYGDDMIIYQDRSEGVLELMKEYCLIPENWTIEDVRINGKKEQIRMMQEIFRHPKVQNSINKLIELLKNFKTNLKEENDNQKMFDITHKKIIDEFKFNEILKLN